MQSVDPLGVLAQPGEVGQDEVDAEHVGVGEHEPAVEQQDPAFDLDGRAVAPDLPEPAEERDGDGARHLQRRGRGPAAPPAPGRSVPSGAGPSGRRHSPAGSPSTRSAAFADCE